MDSDLSAAEEVGLELARSVLECEDLELVLSSSFVASRLENKLFELLGLGFKSRLDEGLLDEDLWLEDDVLRLGLQFVSDFF